MEVVWQVIFVFTVGIPIGAALVFYHRSKQLEDSHEKVKLELIQTKAERDRFFAELSRRSGIRDLPGRHS